MTTPKGKRTKPKRPKGCEQILESRRKTAAPADKGSLSETNRFAFGPIFCPKSPYEHLQPRQLGVYTGVQYDMFLNVLSFLLNMWFWVVLW